MKKYYLLSLLFLTQSLLAQVKNWEITPFVKPVTYPIMQADSSYVFDDPLTGTKVKWQKADVFNPAAIVRNGKVYILFRAEDTPGTGIGFRTSRIGLAVSDDGIHFKKMKDPVLYPTKDELSKYDNPGGCEDPRIVESESGEYVLTYTSWDRKVARLSIATSNDLIHWKKHGPAFKDAYDGKFIKVWSKSGSIVTKQKNGKIVAAKVKGKYWMYWGENPVYLASSADLIHWTPVVNPDGELKPIIAPRRGKYDSNLTEPGPPSLITDKGIVLLYNGKNAAGDSTDTSLLPGVYAGGQVLFDINDPAKVLARSENYFIKPELPFEKSGQYVAGTTFIEGLVRFKNKWFLYYGTADSMVGVAVKE